MIDRIYAESRERPDVPEFLTKVSKLMKNPVTLVYLLVFIYMIYLT